MPRRYLIVAIILGGVYTAFIVGAWLALQWRAETRLVREGTRTATSVAIDCGAAEGFIDGCP